MFEMIKAGTIWTHPEGTIEWLKDMEEGDPVTVDSLLIDGKKDLDGALLPEWVPHMIYSLCNDQPLPDDVVVTFKASI